jgi:hypothetical protein
MILSEYLHGRSLREVADRFGLTVEGVRWIVRHYSPRAIRPQGDTRNNSTGLSAPERAAKTRSKAKSAAAESGRRSLQKKTPAPNLQEFEHATKSISSRRSKN